MDPHTSQSSDDLGRQPTLPILSIDFGSPQGRQEYSHLTGAQYKKMVGELIADTKGEEGYQNVLGLILDGEKAGKLTADEALALRRNALKIDRKGLINWGQVKQ